MSAKCLIVLFTLLCCWFPALDLPAQENTAQETEDPDTVFEDPFAVDEDDLFSDPLGTEGESDQKADSDENGDDMDNMFEGPMIEEIDTEKQDTAPQDDLLVEEEVIWGGKFSGGADSDWSWNNVATADFDFADPSDSVLTPNLSGNLYFDARSKKDFRVFGKFKIDVSTNTATGITGLEGIGIGAVDDSSLPEGWTSEENADGDTEIRNEEGVLLFTIPAESDTADGTDGTASDDEPQTGDTLGLELNVFEFFSDFSWKDRLFFRFGKYTIKWGTGYFWSPADVLNLTSINVEDPTADREGPISLKTQFPFGNNNAYLYLITNFNAKPLELAIAPKVEFLIGNTEIGLAGYYQQALAPRLIATVSTSVSDFDFFGEGVVSWGSDRVFVRASRDQSAAEEDTEDNFELVLDTFEVKNRPFFHLTAGFRYIKTFSEDRGNLALIGQYWYNSEGYKDSTLLKPAYYLVLNSNTNGLYIGNEDDQPEGYTDPPDLTFNDLFNFGRHYGGFTLSWGIFNTDISFTAVVIANLSDLSGLFIPAISYAPFDYLSLALSARFTFGGPGDEYTNQQALFPGSDLKGSTLTLSFHVSLGSGQF